MTSENKTVFQIFIDSAGIYAKHLPEFIKYMSFPVFGQIIGIILSFALSLGYAYTIGASMSDATLSFGITMLLAIPGLIIFTKAFWEYLVAYVALNSMTENTIKSGRIYDISSHKKVATSSKRIGEFITLWLLFGLFTIVSIFPPMWIISAVVFVFLVLLFQVFTFEKNMSAVECFKRSAKLVSADFWKTAGMLIIIGVFSYFLLPKLVEFILGVLQIVKLFIFLLDPIVAKMLPIAEWNEKFAILNIPYMITSLDFTKMILSSIISGLVICFTLPLRSICWTLWYKQLCVNEIKAKSKKKKAKSDDV
ncbi:hypothetical protein IKE67_01295 [bacterium]|nr:hypothetical protein [bacterium]